MENLNELRPKTFTETCSEKGIEVQGNDLFNQLETEVKEGRALSAGEALAKLLTGK